MNESKQVKATDEEFIELLMAISTVSKRLAWNLIKLNQTSQSKKGENHDEQNKRNGNEYQRTTEYCIFY